MFLGHYGVAFALKRVEPKVSLGTLFIAAQLADLLWGCFLLLGWERARIVPGYTPIGPLEFLEYPISHSLVAAIGWALAAAAAYYSWPTRDTSGHWQASVLVGVAVASHWPLDLLVHLPDLPIAGQDSTKLGLGLWNHFGATIAAELLVFGVGLAIYATRRSRRHPVRGGRLAVVVVLLLGTYAASVLGPLPPSIPAVAVGDIGFILLLAAVAGWADRRATSAELAASHQQR